MGLDELHLRYQRLLGELDEAYTAPDWNVRMIDQIADEIVQTELALCGGALQLSDQG